MCSGTAHHHWEDGDEKADVTRADSWELLSSLLNNQQRIVVFTLQPIAFFFLAVSRSIGQFTFAAVMTSLLRHQRCPPPPLPPPAVGLSHTNQTTVHKDSALPF